MDRLLAKSGDVCRTVAVRELAPPAWARRLIESGDDFTLVSARVEGAADLSAAQFEQRTFDAYVSIAQQLARSATRHAVRFWNHVPFITDPADAGRDNYMVFNAGRFRAFTSWFGGATHFDREVATASATGHWERDLVVHCLATASPGVAVNNPRQVAPYHYSQRFGPLPPCFARATRLMQPSAPRLLLVGGTASVRGEDSVHVDDLPNQMRESFVNLAALIGAARADGQTSRRTPLTQNLAAFRELRVYYPNGDHAGEIEANVRAAFPALRRLEMLQADLCRAELLVEIEGVADLAPLNVPGKAS